MILIIGIFYPSLHSNPKNPLIKAFIFSLLAFFGSLLASGYYKERERRSRPKEEHCLMLNLIVEKGGSKDRDRSGLSMTRPRTGTPTGFVKRSRLNFGLRTSPYTVDIYFLLFSFYFFFFFLIFFYCYSFDIISACISHSHPRHAYIHCYCHLFSHLSIILSLFLSLLI